MRYLTKTFQSLCWTIHTVVALLFIAGAPSCQNTPADPTDPAGNVAVAPGGVQSPNEGTSTADTGSTAPVPPAPTTQPTSVSDTPAVVKEPTVTVPTPAAPQLQSGSVLPRFSNTFYRKDARNLPPALAKQVLPCRSGVVIDLNNRRILWQKDALRPYPIASLSKLMTSIMLMEHIQSNPQVTLESVLPVTKEDYKVTRRIRGVYLDPRDNLTLQEFLKCMIISSANDCAHVVGRYLADGDPNRFPAKMNRRAREMGLINSAFFNPHGLPIDKNNTRTENTATTLEAAYLGEYAMGFPEIMKWAGTPADCIREDGKRFDLNSTNKLLRGRVPGITGLKTGYTNTAGHCIIITCERKGRRVMVVVMGVRISDHGKTRDAIAKALLEWAYQELGV